eukprot:5242590-Pleurochrysis_carterae.AAC.1
MYRTCKQYERKSKTFTARVSPHLVHSPCDKLKQPYFLEPKVQLPKAALSFRRACHTSTLATAARLLHRKPVHLGLVLVQRLRLQQILLLPGLLPREARLDRGQRWHWPIGRGASSNEGLLRREGVAVVEAASRRSGLLLCGLLLHCPNKA